MKLNLEEMLPQITGFLQNEAKTETVIGQAFQLGEFHCIPVIRVGMGFGSGMGEGETQKDHAHGEGGGVAGGMGIDPIGFLVSRNDQISFISTKSSQGLSAAFEKVPNLIERFLEQRKEEPVA